MINSPLRYPGGKAKMFAFFRNLILSSDQIRSTYCEPYAGGAGLALELLSAGLVDRIRINDIDIGVYSFWISVLEKSDSFVKKINTVDLSIEEWRNQKSILLDPNSSHFDRGFAFFYINRTNRSGIVEGAGPIGGYHQSGRWKLNARFNRERLANLVNSIARLRDQITVSNIDAMEFFDICRKIDNSIIYLDPPYFVKGRKLYKNFYEKEDHEKIAEHLINNRCSNWILTYDNAPAVTNLYKDFEIFEYSLGYSAGRRQAGKEVMLASDSFHPVLARHGSEWLSNSIQWGSHRMLRPPLSAAI